MSIKTYSELISYNTFEDRYNYLKLNGKVGFDTFGFDRYLNQMFYSSKEWEDLRAHIIVRDNGRDMALDGFDIFGKIYIHHMNPITVDDIVNSNDVLFDPEQLVCVSFSTHNAIHYGTDELKIKQFAERRPGDTIPWRK